jgi:2-iminobutanoate/2-iminopropanoate deaminase
MKKEAMPMTDPIITEYATPDAPKAIGPYSQAVAAGGFLFVSGQLPLDPGTMTVVEGGITEQTMQVMKNIGAILASAGLWFEAVVKTEIFLKDMGTFASVNEVYGSFFPTEPRPARVTVEVARLPRDVMVEIACVACLGQ